MTPRQAFTAFAEIEDRFGGSHSPLYQVLEALIIQGEGIIEQLKHPEVDDNAPTARILLERCLEAHGVTQGDPVLSGLTALEQDLWTLRCSVVDTQVEGGVADQLDRLAQRAGLLVTIAGGTR